MAQVRIWLSISVFLAGILAGCQTGPGLPAARIAFIRHNDLWVADRLGDDPRKITSVGPGALVDDPRWAPDGQRIAFVQSPATTFDPDDLLTTFPTSDILIINADGSRQLLVLDHGTPGVQLRTPAWLPDGSGLLYSEFTATLKDNKSAGVRIALRRLDLASRATTLVRDDALNADVSPTGRQIVYVPSFNAASPTGIWIADLSGSNPRRIFDHPDFSEYHAPRFSRDGQHIVFSASGGPDLPGASPISSRGFFRILLRLRRALAHGLPADLWLISTNGTSLRRLTSIREDMPTPAWLPDSSGLVFQGPSGVYLYDLATDRLQIIYDQGWHAGVDVTNP